VIRGGRVLATLLWAALVPVPAARPQTAATEQEAHRLHHDTAAYITSLEDPGRDAWQKPDEVMAALELGKGEWIADVGAGSGYFAVRLAAAVGENGRVYAVDVEPGMILHMNRRARDAGLGNLLTLLADPDDPLLPRGAIDRVFICDTWHHIGDHEGYLGRLRRALKANGQVVMIDFQKRELPVGPPVDRKIARGDLVREMEGSGFRLVREHTFLPYQYFLVFSP
jgi:ubiquinone/menaquinone biosynthesis C-methylase UbiE